MSDVIVSVTATVCALLVIGVGGIYCRKIVRGEAHPEITTWIIFEIEILMSLVTYLTSHDHGIVRSVTNATDVVSVLAIVIVLVVKRVKRHGARLLLTRDEQRCFKIIGIAFVVWAVSRAPWIANAGFQVVMIVAYWPTVTNLWHWPERSPGEESPEPFITWFMSAVAGLLGSCVAFAGKDGLASLYPLRSTVFCIIVLFLIMRIKKARSD